MKGIAVNIDQLELPPVLYKFRNFNKPEFVDAFFNLQLHIPSVDTFNDPQDSNLPFRYYEEDLTEDNIYRKSIELARQQFPKKDEQFIQQYSYDHIKEGRLLDEHHLQQVDIDEYKKICNSFGVFCLTPNHSNFLMWSYYAESHSGFCVGYDTKKVVSSLLFAMGGLVNYTTEIPRYRLFPKYEEEEGAFSKIFYAKSKVWEHEDEYRLLHIYKNGKTHKIVPEFVSEVIIGCKYGGKEEIDFIERVNKTFPHASIFKMKLKRSGFGVEREVIYSAKYLL